MVRIAISALTDRNTTQNCNNLTAMAFHASLFGFLAKMFTTEMIDTLDKPESKVKTF